MRAVRLKDFGASVKAFRRPARKRRGFNIVAVKGFNVRTVVDKVGKRNHSPRSSPRLGGILSARVKCTTPHMQRDLSQKLERPALLLKVFWVRFRQVREERFVLVCDVLLQVDHLLFNNLRPFKTTSPQMCMLSIAILKRHSSREQTKKMKATTHTLHKDIPN